MVLINRVFLLLFCFNVCAFSSELSKSFPQGSLVIGQNNEANEIFVDGELIKISHDGYYVFPISREQIEPINVTYSNSDGIFLIHQIYIEKQDYDIQRIDGLPESKVTPPESVYKRIKEENGKIGKARAINSDLTFFTEQFIMPVKGIISGVYGSQRILNGKPKWPHYGIDIAAKQGTKIKSSGTGRVTMAEDDLYYTGGTVIMDHGHGISTIYSHLENVIVKVGDEVKQGEIIGTVGSTGRSTGPHLDFRINWFQTRLDPMSILQ